MSHKDPEARCVERYRVNLNRYQAEAVEALARLNRKQTGTYLRDIIEAHLEVYSMEPERMLRKSA